MKALAIILTCSLLGVIVWLMIDARSDAKGVRNQLELMRRQQAGSNVSNATLDAQETRLIEEQMKKSALPPVSPVAVPTPSPSPITLPPTPTPSPLSSNPAVSAALQAAAAAPPPMTPRQRQIMGAPPIAEVKEYARDYGFAVITAGAGRKIEKGMGFAIRRGNAIIGRVKVTEVEDGSAVVDVDPRSIPPGVIIETGDEVIQDLPPES